MKKKKKISMLLITSHVDHLQGREFLEYVYHHQKMSSLFTLNENSTLLYLLLAMTVNKAQEQILKKMGISLQHPFFSLGKLYVAMSRAGSKDVIRVHAKQITDQVCTNNVVYTEVLK